MMAGRQLPGAGLECPAATAQLDGATGSECHVTVGGDWRLSEPVPTWSGVLGECTATSVRRVPANLGKWDTSLALFLVHGRAWCREKKIAFKVEAMPANLQTLLQQVAAPVAPKTTTKLAVQSRWELAGARVQKWVSQAQAIVAFMGECTLSFRGVVQHPRRFRWLDFLEEMQQCWASSLPIVSLVSFLVGVTLAFQGAIQLKSFGAAVFVADLVGLAVVREMGSMMLACAGGRMVKGHGTIRFGATWEVRAVGKNLPWTKRGVFTAAPVAWDGKDYGQLAQRLSEAIAVASGVIAVALPVKTKS